MGEAVKVDVGLRPDLMMPVSRRYLIGEGKCLIEKQRWKYRTFVMFVSFFSGKNTPETFTMNEELPVFFEYKYNLCEELGSVG